jgi:hypothetical protein
VPGRYLPGAKLNHGYAQRLSQLMLNTNTHLQLRQLPLVHQQIDSFHYGRTRLHGLPSSTVSSRAKALLVLI